MARPVKIRNTGNEPVALGGHELPPRGLLVLPYREYLGYAMGGLPGGLALDEPIDMAMHHEVTVRDFGAKGDGVTDDTVAVQTAIGYVGSFGGGTVSFPAGAYRVKTIYIDCNVTVKGSSDGNTAIVGDEPVIVVDGGDAVMYDVRVVSA